MDKTVKTCGQGSEDLWTTELILMDKGVETWGHFTAMYKFPLYITYTINTLILVQCYIVPNLQIDIFELCIQTQLIFYSNLNTCSNHIVTLQ